MFLSDVECGNLFDLIFVSQVKSFLDECINVVHHRDKECVFYKTELLWISFTYLKMDQRLKGLCLKNFSADVF